MAMQLRAVQREKYLRLAIAVVFAAPGLCSSARASALELDPGAIRIAFSVKNLSVAYVAGTFRLASGRVVLDDGDLSRSTIGIVVRHREPDRDTILGVTRPSAVPVSPRRWHGSC